MHLFISHSFSILSFFLSTSFILLPLYSFILLFLSLPLSFPLSLSPPQHVKTNNLERNVPLCTASYSPGACGSRLSLCRAESSRAGLWILLSPALLLDGPQSLESARKLRRPGGENIDLARQLICNPKRQCVLLSGAELRSKLRLSYLPKEKGRAVLMGNG